VEANKLFQMSYQPDFRPTDLTDVGSLVGAFQSIRIKENTEYALRLASLQADLKARLELKKEMLFKISKIVEEIPEMLKNNPVEGVMWLNDIPDYMRDNQIDSSAFETLDFKELADKTWKKLGELENHVFTNLPDAVLAYENAKKAYKESEKAKEVAEQKKLEEINEEGLRQAKKVFNYLVIPVVIISAILMTYVVIRRKPHALDNATAPTAASEQGDWKPVFVNGKWIKYRITENGEKIFSEYPSTSPSPMQK